MIEIGTLVEMTMNSDRTKFGVSRTNSIAPPLVQKLNIEMVITPCSRKMKPCTGLISSGGSHSITYIKTPPITVAAILKFAVFCLPYYSKIGSDDLWTELNRN